MGMEDIASLFFEDDGAQQKMRAQAIANALRGQQQGADATRAIGNLGLLTGDKVLGGFGQAQLQSANQDMGRIAGQEQMLGQAGSQMQQRVLQRALQKQQLGSQMDIAKLKEGGDDRRLRLTLSARDEEARKKAEADAAAAVADGERKLRNDFMGLPTTKETAAVHTAYKGIQTALAAKTPAGDMAGIFSFMKLMDPGSTVREGEYANAQNSANVPDQIRNMYNKAIAGTLLSDTQRADFLGRAKDKFKAQLDIYNQTADAYGKLGPAGSKRENIIPLQYSLDEAPGGPAAQPQTQGVVLISPDGKQVGTVDPSEVDEALRNGWRRR